ncbi:hypothetical protein CKO35_11800 [Ectothiorhodospira shaposhnikovii]|nr:hypothetical protein [Ectothiorhodospira shaposhnikovii]
MGSDVLSIRGLRLLGERLVGHLAFSLEGQQALLSWVQVELRQQPHLNTLARKLLSVFLVRESRCE